MPQWQKPQRRSLKEFGKDTMKTMNESEESAWRMFSEMTYMHGFSYSIYEKHNFFERVLWACITLSFLITAIYYVSGTVDQFLTGDTETKVIAVNTADYNEAADFSHIVYCFDDMFNQSALAEGGISTEVALYALSLVHNLDAEVLRKFYEDANIATAERTLSVTNKYYPEFESTVNLTDLAWQFLEITKNGSYNTALEFLEAFVNKFYANPAEFQRLVMRYGMPCYEMARPKVVDDSGVELSANYIQYEFHHPVTATATKVRISPQRGNLKLTAEEQYGIDYSTGAFDTEFEISAASTTMNGNTIWKKFSTAMTKFHRLNEAGCTETENGNVGLSARYECAAKCRLKVAEDALTLIDGTKACHLVSYLSAGFSKTEPTCSMQRASQLAWKDLYQVVKEAENNCSFSCMGVKSCLELTFDMAESKRLPSNLKMLQTPLPADTIRVVIEQLLLSVSLYEEQYMWSFSDMMANVGGTLGLFIGASMIALLHAMLTVVKSLIRTVIKLCQGKGTA